MAKTEEIQWNNIDSSPKKCKYLHIKYWTTVLGYSHSSQAKSKTKSSQVGEKAPPGTQYSELVKHASLFLSLFELRPSHH